MKLLDFVVERANKRYSETITAEIINNQFMSIYDIIEVLKNNSVSIPDAIDYLAGEEGFNKRFKYTSYAELVKEFINYVKKHKDREVQYVKITDFVGNIIKKIVEEDYYL